MKRDAVRRQVQTLCMLGILRAIPGATCVHAGLTVVSLRPSHLGVQP
jgi:hypothetical protein